MSNFDNYYETFRIKIKMCKKLAKIMSIYEALMIKINWENVTSKIINTILHISVRHETSERNAAPYNKFTT